MSKEIFRSYTELFKTPLGKEVLEDLQSIWRLMPRSLDIESLAQLEGQRQVVRYIEAQIKKGEDR